MSCGACCVGLFYVIGCLCSSCTIFLTQRSSFPSLLLRSGQGLFMETMSEMRNVMLFRRSLVFVTISTFFTYLLCSVAISARYGTGTEENALYALAPGALKCVAAFLLFAHVLVSYTLANQVICRAMHVRIAPADVNKGNWRECFQWLGITSGALAFAWLLANAVSPPLSLSLSFTLSLSLSETRTCTQWHTDARSFLASLESMVLTSHPTPYMNDRSPSSEASSASWAP